MRKERPLKDYKRHRLGSAHALLARGGRLLSIVGAITLIVFSSATMGCNKKPDGKGDKKAEAKDKKSVQGKGDTGKAATHDSPMGDTVKVGIMHSLTGTMAISETSLKDAELMAIEEINAAGGVQVGGKKLKIEAIVEDPASNFETGFPEKANKLLLNDKVAAVFGCWTSASRKSVLKIFEDNNGLLFYPVQYEGNECSKNVIYTGAAPNQQILPAVDYLWKKMGKRRFYLLGSDYIFPRTANYIIKKQLEKVYQAKPVEEKYTPLGHRDYANIVADIRAKKPDVVFSTINGDSNLNFYNELAAAGISAKEMPVLAVSVAEDELRGLDKTIFPKFVGHLAAWNYFQSVDTATNKAFVKKFQAYCKDQSRVTDDPIEAAYFQVYLWKNAVEKAQSTDVDRVREAIKDLVIDAPSGKVKVDGKNFHTYRPFLLGQIRADGQFDIIFRSEEWVRPEPYPPVAYPLDCDWTKGGRIRR
jgi:urea transport system substrate-binding protein